MEKNIQQKLLDFILKRLQSFRFYHKNPICKKFLLKFISRETIIQHLGMDNLALILFVFLIKYNEISLHEIENDCAIKTGGSYIANTSYLPIFLHFIHLYGTQLQLEGTIAVPTALAENAKLIIENNGIPKESKLYDDSQDKYLGFYKYEDQRKFNVRIPLNNINQEIVFYYMLNGTKCRIGKIIGMRFSPIADVIPQQYCVLEDFIFTIKQDRIICTPWNPALENNMERNFCDELLKTTRVEARKAVFRRSEYFLRRKQKKKPIWVFMDRPDRADDNAEILFRYIRKFKSIDAYFIIRESTPDFIRLQSLGNIIPLNSEEHYQLVLSADYIISSQANGIVENPFWDEAEYYRDLYHQAKIIFLQHGVIKDDMSPTLNRYHTNFTGFITSNESERESIINGNYGYTDKQVWLTGLPRFDKLYNDPQRYILVIPSWRMGLMEQVWNEETKSMDWVVTDDFEGSKYKAKWYHLLKNKSLQDACKKYNYRIAFMPHPLMENYFSDTESEKFYEYWGQSKPHREALAQGNILVTDYSSITYDFIFLEKPVLYFQFDRDDFFSNHTYKKGYFDYDKDGFGEVAFNERSLVNILISYLADGCKTKDIYRKKMQEAFSWHDQNSCKRIYDKLMQ